MHTVWFSIFYFLVDYIYYYFFLHLLIVCLLPVVAVCLRLQSRDAWNGPASIGQNATAQIPSFSQLIQYHPRGRFGCSL